MALWSGRFAEAPEDSVRDFTESISFDSRLYKYDIQGSIAHVTMLAECGIISRESSANIVKTLKNIQTRIEQGDFEFRNELEDIHMHIENELIAELGEEGARLHTARSRNDQIALDIRLYMREESALIIDNVKKLQLALLDLAEKNLQAIMPGFTHLQHAQPVLFAHHLLAYTEMFGRDVERLSDGLKRINIMPLGSGALAGSTLPIDRNRTAELLQFPKISQNSMDAVADRDFIIEMIANLAIFTMHVSRLSEDIILWVSSEFDFISLADAFCTGSSLMPQKKNRILPKYHAENQPESMGISWQC